MRRVPCVTLLGILMIFAGGAAGHWIARTVTPRPVSRLAEVELWRQAISAPFPTYPANALKRGVGGVVVARVAVAREGRVAAVDVLEAPDETLAVAVRTGLMRWRFATANRSVEGKATFYFSVMNGRGEVLAPAWNKAHQPGAGARVTAGGWALPGSTFLMSEEECRHSMNETDAVVIDVREPAAFRERHREGSINLPLRTLRVQPELLGASLVVLDCSWDRSNACPLAAWTLVRGGVRRIGVVGR